MNVLVVMFGGVDSAFLERWNCDNLKQKSWGKVIVDDLWDQRDVTTQIAAQLITGKTWRDNGVNDRKKDTYVYPNGAVNFLEKRIFRECKKGQGRRHGLYQFLGKKVRCNSREFVKADITCPTIFDRVKNSKAVYVPAYNPEPTHALDRNILDPRKFPDLGEEAALDLREKHFFWRRKRFMNELEKDLTHRLLMGQFQYIDSTQHLYISYQEEDQMDEIEKAYLRIDEFAGEIISKAEGKYEKILFISDNGAARKFDYKPTHHNRPFYSLNDDEELDGRNMRDFFHHILRWTDG